MSDLLEALKDTNRLIEAILRINNMGHNATESLTDARARAQSITDRIIEASRQAGAVGIPSTVSGSDYEADLKQRRNMEYLRGAVATALQNLEAEIMTNRNISANVTNAIFHLKAGLEGGAA